ncbi:hypothetical protein JCM21900_004511 [Sporobolomyces salmonicolor]
MPPRTETQTTSTSSDEPPSPSSLRVSRLSALHAAISRGSTSSSSIRRTRTSSPAPEPSYELPPPRDPIHLAHLAISTILTIPGPPIGELRHKLFPQLFHDAYSHRVNCRENGLDELIALVQRFRSKFDTMRPRFKSHIVEMDGTATLDAAAVGLTYDVIATPHHDHSRGEHRRDVEEKRTQVMGIVKIFEGRLAQTDVVLDTTPFQDEAQGPQLNCTVM